MKIKLKVLKKEEKDFFLKSDYIRLDDLLKNVGAVSTGGHAKIVIQNGEVKVNGKTCTIRGKKLRNGDKAEFEATVYNVYDGKIN